MENGIGSSVCPTPSYSIGPGSLLTIAWQPQSLPPDVFSFSRLAFGLVWCGLFFSFETGFLSYLRLCVEQTGLELTEIYCDILIVF